MERIMLGVLWHPPLYFGELCDIRQQLFDVYTIIPLDSDRIPPNIYFHPTTAMLVECNFQ